MSGRHTGPIGVRNERDWALHVRNTRRAALTVGILALAMCGALVIIILHKTGVI